MRKSFEFSPKQKLVLIVSFSVFYPLAVSLVFAHFLVDRGMSGSLQDAAFYLFVCIVPVIGSFLKIPIGSFKQKAAVVVAASVAYIMMLPPAIVLAGIALKSDVRQIDAAELCFSMKEKWQDGYDLEKALWQLDGIMRGEGAKFASAWGAREDKGRQMFSYVYSYDIRGVWGKAFNVRNYIEVTAVLTGKKDAGKGLNDIRMESLTCRPPFWKASWGYGPVPSKKQTYPPPPVVQVDEHIADGPE